MAWFETLKQKAEVKVFDTWEALFTRERSLGHRVLVATLICVISVLIIGVVYHFTGTFFHSLTIVTILIVSLYGGTVVSVFYTLVLSLLNDFLFIPPLGSVLENAESVEHLVMNALIGVFVAIIISSLRGVYKRLIAAKVEAEAANRNKSSFLAIISHEIRTPLNGIIGLSDVLRKMEQNEEERRLTELIHNSGRTLLKIINDILDFSKIEAGKFSLENSHFSVRDIAEQVVSVLAPKAAEKAIHLDFVIDENIPKTLYGDSSRISQILFNLTGNAIKFTSAGSVVIKIKRDQVENPTKSVVAIKFSVSDTGIGISEQQQSQLFQPFVQLQKAGTSGESGTGLGLSICRQLLKSMNSEIFVESKKDNGSKFFFTISFSEFSADKLGVANKQRNPDVRKRVIATKALFDENDRPMILVVEDNPTNQVTVQVMLERLGAKVIIASNGADAIDLVSHTKVDLIFMDCQMPIMDGFEATMKMREARITIPIVAMTANSSREDQQACLAVGMSGFISKPITMDVLQAELIRTLRPNPNTLSADIITKLEEAIGSTGKTKVIQAFLTGMAEMQDALTLSEIQSDLPRLQQLGHRYKSSTEIVGATGLTYLFKKLENSNQLEASAQILALIKPAITEIESQLKQLV